MNLVKHGNAYRISDYQDPAIFGDGDVMSFAIVFSINT